jgi:hypothetical protein
MNFKFDLFKSSLGKHRPSKSPLSQNASNCITTFSLSLCFAIDTTARHMSLPLLSISEQPVQAALTHGYQQRPKMVTVAHQEKVTRLPLDIFTLVLPFLGPRGMMNLASTNKGIMALVTHEMVIVSTIVAGSPGSRWSAVNLFKPLRKQLIYLPSRMQMLRILNGTRCESRTCPSPFLCHESVLMGVLLCNRCCAGLTTMYSNETRLQAQYRDTLRQILFFPTESTQKYPLLTRPFHSIDGQCNGNLVSSEEVKRLVRQGRSIEEYLVQNNISVPDRKYVNFLSTTLESAIDSTPGQASRERLDWPIEYMGILFGILFMYGGFALFLWFFYLGLIHRW